VNTSGGLESKGVYNAYMYVNTFMNFICIAYTLAALDCLPIGRGVLIL